MSEVELLTQQPDKQGRVWVRIGNCQAAFFRQEGSLTLRYHFFSDKQRFDPRDVKGTAIFDQAYEIAWRILAGNCTPSGGSPTKRSA